MHDGMAVAEHYHQDCWAHFLASSAWWHSVKQGFHHLRMSDSVRSNMQSGV